MPYVNVQITKGATREQKATIVREITETLVRTLGKKPEHIHIVIQNVELEDWGYSGVLSDEWARNNK
jgi:4-oxalocrotonate tautomerase